MRKQACTRFLAGIALLATTVAIAAEKPKATANLKADPAAYKLLKAAYDARQVLPSNFAGFDADIVYTEGDKTATGQFSFRSDGKNSLNIAGLGDEDYKWLMHNARSFANHRREGDFNETEGKYELAFGKSADTAFGQLVERNDEQKLSSRVRDGKILELTRTGGDKRFIISVLETMECDPGKYIPTRYLVTYIDPKTEVVQNVELFENSYAKVDGMWLPAGRKVVSVTHTAGAGLRGRGFQFQNIKIVK